MTEYLELGSTPANEDCAQVGAEDYGTRMQAETRRYIDQLYKMFPEASDYGVSFVRKSYSHDFGTYHEVCARFDDRDAQSSEFASFVENNLPACWEDEPAPLEYVPFNDSPDPDYERHTYGR